MISTTASSAYTSSVDFINNSIITPVGSSFGYVYSSLYSGVSNLFYPTVVADAAGAANTTGASVANGASATPTPLVNALPTGGVNAIASATLDAGASAATGASASATATPNSPLSQLLDILLKTSRTGDILIFNAFNLEFLPINNLIKLPVFNSISLTPELAELLSKVEKYNINQLLDDTSPIFNGYLDISINEIVKLRDLSLIFTDKLNEVTDAANILAKHMDIVAGLNTPKASAATLALLLVQKRYFSSSTTNFSVQNKNKELEKQILIIINTLYIMSFILCLSTLIQYHLYNLFYVPVVADAPEAQDTKGDEVIYNDLDLKFTSDSGSESDSSGSAPVVAGAAASKKIL